VPCALRIGFWPGPLTAGRPAGGSLPGVRGGPGAGRCTLRAVAFDLKAFFAVVQVSPVEVTAADVLGFLAHQRGDRTVVRLADREPGRPARTIARRLSSVSGLYAYLVARGDTPVAANPVPRGLLTRREGGSRRSRTAPLVRVPRTLPRILPPAEASRLVAGAEVAGAGIGVQGGLGAGACRAGVEGGQLAARGEPVAIGNVSLYRGAGGNALGHGGDRVEESHAGGRGSAGPQAADHARSHREPAEDRAGEQLAHGIAGG
jgi:hypothetical protein